MVENTCEELVDEMLKERIADIEEGLKSEDVIDWLNEYALALSKYHVYRLELSWGGPQDYIEFVYDPESRELLEITYHYLHWGCHAVREVKRNTKEWKTLEDLFFSAILIE